MPVDQASCGRQYSHKERMRVSRSARKERPDAWHCLSHNAEASLEIQECSSSVKEFCRSSFSEADLCLCLQSVFRSVSGSRKKRSQPDDLGE